MRDTVAGMASMHPPPSAVSVHCCLHRAGPRASRAASRRGGGEGGKESSLGIEADEMGSVDD